MISVDTFRALSAQRQAGVLDPARAAAFDRQHQKGNFAYLAAEEPTAAPPITTPAAPPTASPVPPPAPTPTPTPTAPPAAPAVGAAPPAASAATTPTTPSPYPATSGAPRPQGGVSARAIARQRPVDPTVMYADRLGLPPAEMPGGPNEFAERLAGAATAPLTSQTPGRTLARGAMGVLGAPGNTVAAGTEAALRPMLPEGSKTPERAGTIAGIVGDLFTGARLTPGLPGGLYTPGRQVKKLSKVMESAIPAAERAGSRASAAASVPGLRPLYRTALGRFESSMDAARLASDPRRFALHLQRGLGTLDRAFPGGKGLSPADLQVIRVLREVAEKTQALQTGIRRRTAVTKGVRKVAKFGAYAAGAGAAANLLRD